MTQSADYRRFGLAFTGTRPTRRPGDPGIDQGWLRRHRLGAVAAVAWYLAVPFVLVSGFLLAWGPFGWLDTWQLRLFGWNSVILLTILFMPLAFLPLAVARPRLIGDGTPFLLGMRQAFDAKWGPLVGGAASDPQARLRRSRRISTWIAAVGATVLAFFAAKGFHDAASPHAALPEVAFGQLIDPKLPLADAVRVAGVTADRAREWTHDYSVRQDVHHDVYYALRAPGAGAGTPVALLELDETSPQYGPELWNMVDAPEPREGIPELLDDWTADQLRGAGLALAPRVVVLRRQQLHGRDPNPDPLYDGLYAMFGFVGLFTGLVFWWAAGRASAKLAGADAGLSARS